jgi:hypothetical protein
MARNALPAKEPPSAVRRFLAQFALPAAPLGRCGGHLAGDQAVEHVHRADRDHALQCLVGLRQVGKAESAMNALQPTIKAAARGFDPGQRDEDHLRPGRAIHHRRQPGADRDRKTHLGSIKTSQSMSLSLLTDARGRRLRGPQRDRDGLRHQHIQQLEDERDRAGRGCRGSLDHACGLPAAVLTVRLTGGQWGLALLRGRRAAPPGREAGKWTARRTTSARRAASAGSMTRIGNQNETAPMKTARTPRSYHTRIGGRRHG